MKKAGNICGIDIGPETSVICAGDKICRVPSYISFTRLGKVKVGSPAKDDLRQDRIMALRHRKPQERNVFNVFPSGKQDKLYSSFIDREYTRPELLSPLISDLVDEVCRETPRRCIYTLPVWADERMIQIIRDASSAAGIGSVEFVLKPLAACYACKRQKSGREDIWMVVDWSARSLDLAVVGVSGTSLKLLDSLSDGDLGEESIDKSVSETLLSPYLFQHYSLSKFFPDAGSSAFINEVLLYYAAHARERLSQSDKIDILSREDELGYDVYGVPVELDMELTRPQLDSIQMPLLKRVAKRVEGWLSSLSLEGRVSRLVLVSDSLAAPLLADMLNDTVKPGAFKLFDTADVVEKGAASLAVREEKVANNPAYQEWNALSKIIDQQLDYLIAANNEFGGEHDEQVIELHSSVAMLKEDPDIDTAQDLLQRIDRLYNEITLSCQLSAYVRYQSVMFREEEWKDPKSVRVLLDDAMSMLKMGQMDKESLEGICSSLIQSRL